MIEIDTTAINGTTRHEDAVCQVASSCHVVLFLTPRGQIQRRISVDMKRCQRMVVRQISWDFAVSRFHDWKVMAWESWDSAECGEIRESAVVMESFCALFVFNRGRQRRLTFSKASMRCEKSWRRLRHTTSCHVLIGCVQLCPNTPCFSTVEIVIIFMKKVYRSQLWFLQQSSIRSFEFQFGSNRDNLDPSQHFSPCPARNGGITCWTSNMVSHVSCQKTLMFKPCRCHCRCYLFLFSVYEILDVFFSNDCQWFHCSESRWIPRSQAQMCGSKCESAERETEIWELLNCFASFALIIKL